MSDPQSVEIDHTDEHGPVFTTWFVRGMWATCKCGYAPRDNGLLNEHWAEHGFRVYDAGGHLVVEPIQ